MTTGPDQTRRNTGGEAMQRNIAVEAVEAVLYAGGGW